MAAIEPTEMYEIRDLLTGGKGLFATRDISPGTLILSEHMLLRLETPSFTPTPLCFPEKARNKVISRVKTRTAEQFAAIQQHCRHVLPPVAAEETTQENLLEGNNRAKGSLIDALKLGGLKITRDMKTIDVRAMKMIKEGEEITYCTDNPFRPREKRREFVCGSPCDCEICTRKPSEEAAPNENLYKGLDRRFEKVAKFRARFFKEDDIVNFGDSEGWDELLEKAKQINAAKTEERRSVWRACKWIDEQRRNLGLMHPCFAEVCEIIHIINMAYVAEHGHRNVIARNDQYGVRDSLQRDDDADDDEKDADVSEDDGRGANDREEGSRSVEGIRVFVPSNTEQLGARPDLNPAEDGAKDTVSDDVYIGERAASKHEDADPGPGDSIEEALTYAWMAKLAELDIIVACYGFEHESSQHVLQQAWSVSIGDPQRKEGLKTQVLEYGHRLEDDANWRFNVVDLDLIE